MTEKFEKATSTKDIKNFIFENKEPRFMCEETNVELKEKLAQYAEYIQHQIEAHLKVEKGYFGEEVGYSLCPRGGMGSFEIETTGGGPYWRLRGVSLEEELIDEYSELGDDLAILYPALVAHEVCHDFEYTEDNYDDYYSEFAEIYNKKPFFYHLKELKIDKKSFSILKKVELDVPEGLNINKGRLLFNSFILEANIELQRFKKNAEEGKIGEIMGEDEDIEEQLNLKFARSIARTNYVFENLNIADEIRKKEFRENISEYEKKVKTFLKTLKSYKKPNFDRTVCAFKKFLATEN